MLMNLFIIIDQPAKNKSPLDITINFTQSQDFPSSINEIRFSIQVPHSNFTINNHTTMEFNQYEIPVFHWQNSTANTYDLIDIIRLNSNNIPTDKSLCKWAGDQWDRIFNINIHNNFSYVYFIQSNNSQLSFTLNDTTNNTSIIPSPFINILYCVPYKLGLTEIIILACFGAVFLTAIILLSIVYHYKGEDQEQIRYFKHYYAHRRHTLSDPHRHFLQDIRYRSNSSIYTLHEDN